MEDGNLQWRWWGGELPYPPAPEPPESRLTSLWDAWGFGVPIIGQVFALTSALSELRLARQEDRTFVEEAEFAKEYLPASEVPMQHGSFVKCWPTLPETNEAARVGAPPCLIVWR